MPVKRGSSGTTTAFFFSSTLLLKNRIRRAASCSSGLTAHFNHGNSWWFDSDLILNEDSPKQSFYLTLTSSLRWPRGHMLCILTANLKNLTSLTEHDLHLPSSFSGFSLWLLPDLVPRDQTLILSGTCQCQVNFPGFLNASASRGAAEAGPLLPSVFVWQM